MGRWVPALVLALVLTATVAGASALAADLQGAGGVWAPFAALGEAIRDAQRWATQLVAGQLRVLREDGSPAALAVAVGLGFAYGVVHALGPGHGKAVVMGYFLSREARIGRGVLMGFQIGFLHVLSAIVLVVAADFLLRRTLGAPQEIREVRLVAYGMIVLVGGWMLWGALRRGARRLGSPQGHVEDSCGHGHPHHGHGHAHGHAHAHAGESSLLSLGVGLVPCTGSLLVMLYAMANGMLVIGLGIVGAIGLGMSITMAGLGLASVLARTYVAERLSGPVAATALDLGGALVVLGLGITLWATA